MTLNELQQRLIDEYNSRPLKTDRRYSALNKVMDFLKKEYKNIKEDVSASLPNEKESLKAAYTEYRGKKISCAESSVINEFIINCRQNIANKI